MCTLTVAWRAFDGAPVAVAANRDEALDRPSEPPGRYLDDPAVIAPRDAEAGGTWIGYNERGVFVGITNRWVEGFAAERSRGLLVRDCLTEPTARDARETLEATVDAFEYDGFNLVVADATDAFYAEWDGNLSITALDPGVHVVVNVGADGSFFEPPRRPEIGVEQADNAVAVRDALRPRETESAAEWLDRAATVLGDHDYGVCIHEAHYGTRSSSLILLDETPTYRFAAGPPCRTPYRRVESQL
ncbi:NRDE family protein [Haloferacaceae archaeon DSL9]